MVDRKAPAPQPQDAARPDLPPAPHSRCHTLGRITQLTEQLRSATPFQSVRLSRELGVEVDRLRVSLTDEERAAVKQAAAGELFNREKLVRIIERLTGERFLE